MNRHKPGTIIWHPDTYLRLYQSWYETFGNTHWQAVAVPQRKAFEQRWAKQLTRESGHTVKPAAVNQQLSWGFGGQATVKYRHFWTYCANKYFRQLVQVRTGTKHKNDWPATVTIDYQHKVKK